MTPKEKAESLLELMSNQTYKYQPYAGATCLEAEVGYEAGKKCALIAVDEIINNDGFTRHDDYLTEYWQEVREEIGRYCVKAYAKCEIGQVETFGEVSKSNNRNAYPIAMAEKRALSRAILKLAGFYQLEVYGEDEVE